jgi:hypothetical protein
MDKKGMDISWYVPPRLPVMRENYKRTLKGEHMKQCPSCGGNCGYSKSRGCQYGKREDKPCNTHPNAPHGFLRNVSHNAGRYVCECEHWEEKK